MGFKDVDHLSVQELLAVIASGELPDGSLTTPPTSGNLRVSDADVSDANPVPTDVGVVTVVGFNSPVEIAVTTSGAYAAGDCVGGLITLPSALRANDEGAVMPGIFHSLVIKDYGGGTANLMIALFKTQPVGLTYTDNAAFPTLTGASGADADKLVAVREVISSDWKIIGGISVASLGGFGIVCPAGATTAYYMAIQTVGGVTIGANTLKVIPGFLPD